MDPMTRTLLVATALLGACVDLATVFPGGSVGAASAQERGGVPATSRDAMRTACRDDFRKFCAGVQPGGGRIRQCMLARESELSSVCRTALRQSGNATAR